jgi:hypothetical protein
MYSKGLAPRKYFGQCIAFAIAHKHSVCYILFIANALRGEEMEMSNVNMTHLRGAMSTGRTAAPWELEALSTALDLVTRDERFQAALQRYAHGNGSSQAIAQAAIAAIAKATGSDA